MVLDTTIPGVFCLCVAAVAFVLIWRWDDFERWLHNLRRRKKKYRTKVALKTVVYGDELDDFISR